MEIKQEIFGKTINGEEVLLFTLSNKNGITIKIINYGGIITSLVTPDKNGKFDNIVLGFDNIEDYQKDHPCFGALIGRYANRIAKGKFTLDGKEYNLVKNNGNNHLHGGTIGFDKIIWNAEPFQKENEVSLKLKYLSKDMEEGYPGNLHVKIIYTLTNENELRVSYEAETDKNTPINLTQHSYFNLAGEGSCSVLDHELLFNADKYTVVDEELIPTGELKDVVGTSLDFTKPYSIGSRIKDFDPGYDYNYVLNKDSNELSFAARVREPKSGRIMEVFTTQPGIHFYTANYLDGSLVGPSGNKYKKHYGFCFETQHFPDSPNQPEFPSSILRKGETYKQITIFKWLTSKD